mgnify:CR=1 FL=1
MKIKDNVMFQYTASTLLVILVFSFVLGNTIANWTRDLQIRKHLDLYPQIAEQVLSYNPEAQRTLASANYENASESLQGLVEDMLLYDDLFRIKIWGNQGVVLWSDDKSIIGKQFPNNQEFLEAWQGKLSYSISEPDIDEQASESGHTLMMEIYTPILYMGKVVGVIEMYEATDDLYLEIQTNSRTIWLAVGAFGLSIYALLYILFYRAHRRQIHLIRDLEQTQSITIMSLAAVTETRDKETGRHILRTVNYMELLANALKNHPRFKASFSGDAIKILVKSSPLHDIGKVGVPDRILLKPGPLTAEEFEEIKKHPTYGRDALSVAEKEMGSNSFLQTARIIAYSHHEKWDGSGYPEGLIGDQIPVAGRLMALADVYDALISERVYKKAFSHQTAVEIIQEGKGKHFDPDVVDAFLKLEQEFNRIAQIYVD